MSSQARKPYLNLKSSIAELFKAETRYLKQSNQIESVFEKPYLDQESQAMHLKIPKPDWPTWYLPPWKLEKWKIFPPGTKGGAKPTVGCPGCALYADPSFNCAKDPVEIHAGIYCTNTPGAATNRLVSKKTTNYDHVGPFGPVKSPTHGSVVTGVVAGDTVLAVYAEKGTIKSVSVGAWAYIGPSAAVFVDPALPEHRICGRMIDGAGSVCIACADVKCCNCAAPPSAFSIVSYDSTIAPGGTAYVTVTGGCEPYTFSVSGLGYTIASSKAIGTVTSADGTCGVNYGAVATVTIKDVCGTSKTCKIRNAGGGWLTRCSWSITAPCSPAVCNAYNWCDNLYEKNSYVDDDRWEYLNWSCRAGTCSWGGGGPSGCVTAGYGDKLPSSCPTSANTCTNGQECPGDPGCLCIPNGVAYHQWGCV